MHKNSDFMVKKKSNLDDSSTGGNTDEIKMKLSRLKAKLKDSKRKKPVTNKQKEPRTRYCTRTARSQTSVKKQPTALLLQIISSLRELIP